MNSKIKTITSLILLSLIASFAILLSGAVFTPLILWFILVFYIFLNFKNSIVLIIGVTPMMNIGVLHLGMVDLRISQLVWVPILIAGLLTKIFNLNINKSKLDLKVKAALFFLIGSSLLSIIPSSHPLISFRESLQIIYLVSIFLVIISEINSVEILNKVVKMILITSVIFTIFGFIKSLLGYSMFSYIEIDNLRSISFNRTPLQEQYAFAGNVLFKRADAFFLGAVATAAYLIPIVILSTSLLFNKENLKPMVRRLCYFCSSFCSLLILLTFSRAGIVILFLLLMVLYFLKRRVSKQLLIVIFCFFIILSFSTSHRVRLREIAYLEEGSTQDHLRFWKQAVVMFINKPLLGYGAGSYNFQNYLIDVPLVHSNATVSDLPHNMFLLMAAETGIIGVISLFSFLFLILRKMKNSLKVERIDNINNIVLGLFIGIIGLVLMNLTMNFFKVEVFWIFLGLGYASFNIAKKQGQLSKS